MTADLITGGEDPEAELLEEEALTAGEDQVPVDPASGESEDDAVALLSATTATISATDWTVETLLGQMRKGRIDLSPRFQRRSAWTTATKSRFIESLLLSYPIPQLVLAEKLGRPGHFLVIDGKQRLLALRQFFASDGEDPEFESYRLTGRTLLKDLKGRDATQLRAERPDLLDQLDNHTVRTVAIRNWSQEAFLYTLFLRLNTGSVPLSPQELRQALEPGPFVDFVDLESGESPGLRFLLGNPGPDRRMIDAEILVRFLGLNSGAVPYRGNLKLFLDATCGYYNENWSRLETTVRAQLASLELAVECGRAIFGDNGVCRKWNQVRYERALNRAVFDIQMFAFSKESVRTRAADKKDELVEAFHDLCDRDVDFLRAITSTTKTTAAFRARFDPWIRVVRTTVGVDVGLPPALSAPVQ